MLRSHRTDAVTVNKNRIPAPIVAGAASARWVAVAAAVAMKPEVPVIEAVALSAAVIVWVPAVFRVVEKVPRPFVRLVSAGRIDRPSLLVK